MREEVGKETLKKEMDNRSILWRHTWYFSALHGWPLFVGKDLYHLLLPKAKIIEPLYDIYMVPYSHIGPAFSEIFSFNQHKTLLLYIIWKIHLLNSGKLNFLNDKFV